MTCLFVLIKNPVLVFWKYNLCNFKMDVVKR